MSEIQAILAENEKLSREMLRANADSIDQSRRFPRENLEALGKAGVPGLLIPAQYGLAEMSRAVEEQAQNCAAVLFLTCLQSGSFLPWIFRLLPKPARTPHNC